MVVLHSFSDFTFLPVSLSPTFLLESWCPEFPSLSSGDDLPAVGTAFSAAKRSKSALFTEVVNGRDVASTYRHYDRDRLTPFC